MPGPPHGAYRLCVFQAGKRNLERSACRITGFQLVEVSIETGDFSLL